VRDRLKVRPQWAISVFLPPGGQRWICVQSNSRENVEKLCINFSTFPHPLQIFFVPVKERLDWLPRHHEAPRITPPAWVRIKKKSELYDLFKTGFFDETVYKYANDLAYVPWTDGTMVIVCPIPRLPLPISSGDSGEADLKRRPKTKRRQRLLHPMMLGDSQVASRAMNVAHMIDPSVWWQPKSRYGLKNISPGVYQLTKPNSQKTVMGGDKFVLPFAYCLLPSAALHSTGVVPRLRELKIFGEGLAVGSQQFKLPGPDPEFLRWTYENHVAARVEIGHKVEAKVDGGMVQGVIVDIFSNEATLCINNTEEIAVDVCWVRRFYEKGDSVKVVKASNKNCEGWVVGIHEGEIEVFDHNAKKHVGRC
jgi:hypothetical protein